jgi:hypothetical protein
MSRPMSRPASRSATRPSSRTAWSPGPKPGVDHAPTIAFLESVLRNCRRRLTTARAAAADRRLGTEARLDADIEARQLAQSIDHFAARLARFDDVDEATSRGGAHRSALPRPATSEDPLADPLEALLPANYQGRWRPSLALQA